MELKTKEKVERAFLEPLAGVLDISPNYITILSIVLTLFSGYFVLQGQLMIAAVIFAVAGLMDSLDGLVAKLHNRATKFGRFFDYTADRINDSVIIAAIIIAGLIDLYTGLFVLILVLVSSYMSACIDAGTKKKAGEKISMRFVRILVLFFALLSGYAIAVTYAMYALLLIGIYSFASRLSVARKLLKD